MIRWTSDTVCEAQNSKFTKRYEGIIEDGMYRIEDFSRGFREVHETGKFKSKEALEAKLYALVGETPIIPTEHVYVKYDETITDIERGAAREDYVSTRAVKEAAIKEAEEEELKKKRENLIHDLTVTLEVAIKDGKVYLTSNTNTRIKYTTDGKNISKFSKVYREPFDYKEGMIIKAAATATNIGDILDGND